MALAYIPPIFMKTAISFQAKYVAIKNRKKVMSNFLRRNNYCISGKVHSNNGMT